MSFCDNCGRVRVPPIGPSDAPLLLVGDAPTVFDVRDMEPWTGPAGDLLRLELRKAGINPMNTRITNMWQHAKHKDCGVEHHIDYVLYEMQFRPTVVLMGADTVQWFIGMNVSDLSGLRVDQLGDGPEKLPQGIGQAFALFNPALALHDTLGEIRHGLSVVAEAMND